MLIYWVSFIFYAILKSHKNANNIFLRYFSDTLKPKDPFDELIGCIYFSNRIVTGMAMSVPAEGRLYEFSIPLTVILVSPRSRIGLREVRIFFVDFCRGFLPAVHRLAVGNGNAQVQRQAARPGAFQLDEVHPGRPR